VLSREGREQFILSLQGTFFWISTNSVFSHFLSLSHVWNMKFHSIPLAGTFGAKGRLLGHKFPGFQREEAGFFFETSSSTLSGRFWCSNKQSSGPSFEWHDLGMSARTRMAVDIHPILHPCDSVFT
jgi:hypothetical protein